MRIAIDASRTTVTRVTGTEHYATQLIRELIRLNTQHDMTLYFRNTPPEDLFPSSECVTYRIVPFRRAWTHIRFAAALWRDRPDVTFVPAHTLPVSFPGRGVVTVHDLGYKHFPQAHRTSTRLYLDWTTRYNARRATIVLADSQATANDLTKFYETSPEKIRVVYPGADVPCLRPDKTMPRTDTESIDEIRRKHQLPERYFLFIGTLQPRKNIARIVQAYAKWRESHPNDETGLVLAGGKGWLFDEEWIAGVDGVVLPGYIDNADKGVIYASAVALVFPTLYEGFGFPVLEAMGCGTPVITSNTSSLPELVGDAGLLVDPLDFDEIADAMTKISDDAALRQSLRDNGYIQVAKFTWRQTARQTIQALEIAAYE